MLKVIKLNKSTIRVISGDLYKEIDIDWGNYDLNELVKVLEALFESYVHNFQSLKKIKNKDMIRPYKGGSHIDIIGDKGSLNILKIVDIVIILPQCEQEEF